MIDLNEIKKCTNDRFFQRGRDLYNIGKVLSIDIEKDEESGLINVKGDVRGSGRNIYQATVGIDDEFIVFSECECLASLVNNWKTEFEKRGYKVSCMIRGLGEYAGIQNMFINHIKRAISD